MKQRLFALITALCMAATTLPAVFADGGESGELTIGTSAQEQCSCVALCTEGNINPDCPVCSLDPSACEGTPLRPMLFGAPRADVEINETNFPDQKFRDYVKQNLDTDGDYNLSAEEIEKVTAINVNNKKITSLTGIEYFTNLQTLNCYSNQLTELDVSNNTELTTLSCSYNRLTSLDVSDAKALATLYCDNNNLTSLDVSNNTKLATLNCDSNRMTSLDVSSNTKLATLYCNYNQLTSLDVSGAIALATLYCNDNRLTSLDVSGAIALTTLNCYNNNLTSLDVSNNTELATLICDNNNLTSLDVSKNTKLATLLCESNQLTSLDVSSNTELATLYCYNNNLTSLDLSGAKALATLNCYNNQLTELDVSNNTKLATLNCNDNQLTELDVSNNTKLATLWCGAQKREIPVPQGADGSWSLDLSTLVDWSRVSDVNVTDAALNVSTVSWIDRNVQPMVTYNYETILNEIMDVTLTLIPQQPTQPQPPQPTQPQPTAPADTDHTVQSGSGQQADEESTGLPSLWERAIQRIRSTPVGGRLKIYIGSYTAIPDRVLDALRSRAVTATFYDADGVEVTLPAGQVPPENVYASWTLRQLGNYLAQEQEQQEQTQTAQQQAPTETTTETPASDTGKPNPETGAGATPAAALLVAVVALTGLGFTLKRR